MAKGDPENGDRVLRTDTGTYATYVQRHHDKGRGCHDVLLDTGPKVVTPWDLDTPLLLVTMPRICPRCGGPHRPFDCEDSEDGAPRG